MLARLATLRGGLRCALLTSASFAATGALAQAPAPAAGQPTLVTQTPAAASGNTLQEVVVTAQKRAQNLQDVPISVTALTAQTLAINRVQTVADLSAVAPALTVQTAAGGVSLPAFTLRGITSYGVVPGSDKEVSQYLDGVYIGSPTGSISELPDVDQIEVLKGPQGTLFGRDATAGAISLVTHTPTGKLDFHQELTGGNYDQFRSKTRLDLPSFDGLSASITYVHNERQGDIRNLGAGTQWNYADVPGSKFGVATSPKYLGDENENAVLAGLRYHPNSKLDVIYKFDWSENHSTPNGTGQSYQNFGALGPAGGALTGIVASQPNPSILTPIQPNRPDAVNNSFTLPAYSVAWGHNLTAQYQVNNDVTVKDILSYRQSAARAAYQLDGYGGVTLGPNLPFEFLADISDSISSQWSNEVQLNASYRYVTITAGYLHYHATTYGGGSGLSPNVISFGIVPNYSIPATGQAQTFVRQDSDAGYIQAEGHITSQLDLIGGYRYTHDTKFEDAVVAGLPPTSTYGDSKPSYLLDLDYKPFQHTLLYGKYSTAFMSGGSAFGLNYAPETAESYEVGAKSDFLDRRLRADLAIYTVRYKDVQAATGGTLLGLPQVGALQVNQGTLEANGGEFEMTALPMRGLTFGLGSGYTNAKYVNLNPVFGTTASYPFDFRPHWTADVSAAYETEPLFGPANLSFSIQANYRGREAITDVYPPANSPALQAADFSGEAWVVNARVALMHLPFAYGKGQIALWARNLNNDKSVDFATEVNEPGGQPFLIAPSYQQARTYGVDVTYDF